MLSQFAPEYFPKGIFGEHGCDNNLFRSLELGESAFAKFENDLLGEIGLRFGYHNSHNFLAINFIMTSNDTGFRNVGVFEQHFFDVFWENIFAATDDEIFN